MSAWISFIKEFAKKNGVSYGCALSDPNCSKEYRESKGIAKSTPAKKPEPAATPAAALHTPFKLENIEPKLLRKLVLDWFDKWRRVMEKKLTKEDKAFFKKSGLEMIKDFKRMFIAHLNGEEAPEGLPNNWLYGMDSENFTPIKLVRYIANNLEYNKPSATETVAPIVPDKDAKLLKEKEKLEKELTFAKIKSDYANTSIYDVIKKHKKEWDEIYFFNVMLKKARRLEKIYNILKL